MRDGTYWVWSTHPTTDHVAALEGGTGWWTCHTDTRQGDLAIVYVSAPDRHIAFLVEATSDSYLAPSDPKNPSEWDSDPACGFRTVAHFQQPLTLAFMKSDQILTNGFSALRANFQMRSYRVPVDIWSRVVAYLVAANSSTQQDVRSAQL